MGYFRSPFFSSPLSVFGLSHYISLMSSAFWLSVCTPAFSSVLWAHTRHVLYPCVCSSSKIALLAISVCLSGAKKCVRQHGAVICWWGGTSPQRAPVVFCWCVCVWLLGDVLSVWLCSLLMTHHVNRPGCSARDCWPACLSSMHAQQPRMPACVGGCVYVCLCVWYLWSLWKTNHLGHVKKILQRAHGLATASNRCLRGFISIWPQCAALSREQSCQCDVSRPLAAPTDVRVSCELVKLIMLKQINCPAGEKPVRLPVISLYSPTAVPPLPRQQRKVNWDGILTGSSYPSPHISTFPLLVYLISSHLPLFCSHALKYFIN